MTRLVRSRSTVLALGAALAMLAGGGAVADAAAVPGWRVTDTVGAGTQITNPETLLAVGPDDAFATFFGCTEPCGSSPDFTVSHWNGHFWRRLPFPERLHGFVGAINAVRAIGASGPDNLWVFKANAGKAGALHWNGRKWSVKSIPSWVLRNNGSGNFDVSAVMTGPDSGWVFSSGLLAGPTPAIAARLVHGRWIKVRLPQVPWSVSSGQADDLWVVGIKQHAAVTSSRFTLMHWDGHSWHTMPAPVIGKPRNAFISISPPAVAGPRDIWITEFPETTSANPPQRILHWNGSAWTRIRRPADLSFLTSIASDGHGGLWAVASGGTLKPGLAFAHFSGGRWTRQLVPGKGKLSPAQVLMLTRVPGTTTMLAAGLVAVPHATDEGILAAIWQHG